MIYLIRCKNYRDADFFLREEVNKYKSDLDICMADRRWLVVRLKDGDVIHYVPESRLELWSLGRKWTEIESLGDLVGKTKIELKPRTPEEQKAYVDGYNLCFEQFAALLQNKTVAQAMTSMAKTKKALNLLTEREEELDCNDCYYSMQNCNDRSICCEDETALCDDFESVAEEKKND